MIREARPDERALVGELRMAAYQALSPESAYSSLRDFGFHGGSVVLVADDGDANGGLLGTVTLELFGPDSELARDKTEADIRAFAVAPAAQGRGVGRRLLRGVSEHAAARGVTWLRLCTMPNMTTARHLYETAGFTRTPDLDFEAAPGLTLRAYALRLPSGS